MTNRRTTRALTIGIGLLMAVTVFPAPSYAVSRRAQQTYDCIYKIEGYDGTKIEPTVLAVQLDVPDSVTPGQTLSLRGMAELQLNDSFREGADYFGITHVDGYSDTLSATLTTGGRTVSHRADRWQTGRQPIGDPIVVRAPITFPAFTVPANSTGSVTVALPQNGFTPNPLTSSPKRVAFDGRAVASGTAGSYTYTIGCYLPKGAPNVIARIPVAKAAVAAAPDQGAAPKSSGSAAAPATAAAPPTAKGTTSANPFGAAPSAAAQPGTTAAGVATTPTAYAATEQGSGIRVPTSALWLAFLGLLCAAAVHSVWLHYRMRLLRQELDG